MKKIFTLLFCLACTGFMANAQINSDDLQGNWTLTALDAQDSVNTLTAAQKAALTTSYLHDFPLTLTTFSFNISDQLFTLVHHGNTTMNGNYRFSDPDTKLILVPAPCPTCAAKEYYFVVRALSTTELIIDAVGEDQNESIFPRMTFTK